MIMVVIGIAKGAQSDFITTGQSGDFTSRL